MVVEEIGSRCDVSRVNEAFSRCGKQLLETVVPLGFIGEGGHSGEGIIKDDVKLRGNVLDAGIQDGGNRSGVMR
jgi:hypothetical protein